MTSDFKHIVWTAVSLKIGNIKIIIFCFVCLIFTRVSYEHKPKVNHNLYKDVHIPKIVTNNTSVLKIANLHNVDEKQVNIHLQNFSICWLKGWYQGHHYMNIYLTCRIQMTKITEICFTLSP